MRVASEVGGRLRRAVVLAVAALCFVLSGCTECSVGIIISPIVITWPPPGCSNSPLEELFSTDVFSGSDWLRTDSSVWVDQDAGWLVIGTGPGYNDAAWRDVCFTLPVTLEARMRLVSGGLNYRLPWIAPVFSDGTCAWMTFLNGIVPGKHGGWNFNGWTFVLDHGPSAENQWATITAELRTDGGSLSVKYDGDPGFTAVLTRTWTLPNRIVGIRVEQPWDSVCHVDYIRIESSDP